MLIADWVFDDIRKLLRNFFLFVIMVLCLHFVKSPNPLEISTEGFTDEMM